MDLVLEQSVPARLGMITPSSNTALEPVTYRLLAGTDQVTVHFSRLPVTRITTDEEQSAQFTSTAMVEAGRLLADAKVDVIAWNGTAGSWLGPQHDRELAAQLTAQTSTPATTSTLAFLDAFRLLGVTRLGLVTPYDDAVAAKIVTTYAEQGVEVVSEDHLGITDNETFGRITPATVAEQVRRVANGADAVAIVCTNVRGGLVAPHLEIELGIPILDSVAVTLWGALRTAGSSLTLPAAGFLLGAGDHAADATDVTDRQPAR